MDLLLDTCAFIWWDSGGGMLSSAAASALHDPANRLHLSHASLWEIISQAKLRGFSVVTNDGEFSQYGVPLVW